MEDVLEVYQQPYDPDFPVVCMDENPYQLLGETRPPIPMKRGRPKRLDDEYVRNGTCCIFLFTEALSGWRHAEPQEHRTKVDWAHQIRHLLDIDYPECKKVRLLMDKLNTHTISSLYEAFPPELALRLARRLEIHYTPKHGSWLNIAEIELSAMTRQCLDRRIDNIPSLMTELSAWETARNSMQKGVDWHFTTPDARTRQKHLYPQIKS
jgi:hypothetical protein